ncbi:hypothetical protein JB92DRAFT_1727306 [Gautieria morchelliformis]|nr:hypothetical protein JB92DRAFT_1727306 [Gautieria morchelliformis]
MNTFVFAGLETTAIAVTRLLHLLAKRPEVQARLRTEIRNAKQSHLSPTKHLDRDAWKAVELSYDELMALPYLDAIVRETHILPPRYLVEQRGKRRRFRWNIQYGHSLVP